MRQRGVALLVAIIIFAFATMVAAAVTYSKAMTARRAAATLTLEHALQAGMAAEALASIALEQDGGAARTETTQDWAQTIQPVELEDTGIWIAAQVEDMGGRFNLNSVVKWDDTNKVFAEDSHQVEVFRHILAGLDIDQRFADLLVDWIDTDIAPSSAGGEDTLYLTQVPPYRPPNTFITHTSELLALPGFGRDNYRKIAPHVTALPYDVPLNACTAGGLVLDATLNDPQNQVQYRNEDLPTLREKGCYPLKNVYTGVIGNTQLKSAVDGHVEEKSSWFRLRTNVRIGTAEFVLYSLMYREPTNRVRTVQRSFGSE